MAGNKSGGIKAGVTNKKKYGDDFYVKIGALGGSKSRGGGFAKDPALASRAGKIGGMRSRRSKVKKKTWYEQMFS